MKTVSRSLIREAFRITNFPREVADVMTASWRTTERNRYKSVLMGGCTQTVAYKVVSLQQAVNYLGDHSFSTYAKYFEKIIFLTLSYIHVSVRIRGYEMLVFRKVLRTY